MKAANRDSIPIPWYMGERLEPWSDHELRGCDWKNSVWSQARDSPVRLQTPANRNVSKPKRIGAAVVNGRDDRAAVSVRVGQDFPRNSGEKGAPRDDTCGGGRVCLLVTATHRVHRHLL